MSVNSDSDIEPASGASDALSESKCSERRRVKQHSIFWEMLIKLVVKL